MIIKNRIYKICLLIDVAILSDRNLIQKEGETKLKYKNVGNVEYEMLFHTSNHWGHWNCN
jgi:hypothetical protein